MNFELTDYSAYYYAELAGEHCPARRGGKFVQLRDTGSDREFLVLSPAGLSLYHAHIVERFCALQDLDGHWNAGRTRYELVDPAWEIVGGGHWLIDVEKQTLELGSSSQAYGRFDPAGLENRIRATEALRGYRVRLERG